MRDEEGRREGGREGGSKGGWKGKGEKSEGGVEGCKYVV